MNFFRFSFVILAFWLLYIYNIIQYDKIPRTFSLCPKFLFPELLEQQRSQGILNEIPFCFIDYIITFSPWHDKYFYPSKTLMLYIFCICYLFN